jgi:hypothetical protein
MGTYASGWQHSEAPSAIQRPDTRIDLRQANPVGMLAVARMAAVDLNSAFERLELTAGPDGFRSSAAARPDGGLTRERS